jgi:hypothetical protein
MLTYAIGWCVIRTLPFVTGKLEVGLHRLHSAPPRSPWNA